MNPYAPPTTIREAAHSPWRHPLVMLMTGLTVGHGLSLVSSLPDLLMLVSTGSVSMLTALGTLVGCMLLYSATLYMPTNPKRAKKVFLCAAVGIGLSTLGWGMQHPYMCGFMAGVPESLLGFWLATRLQIAPGNAA